MDDTTMIYDTETGVWHVPGDKPEKEEHPKWQYGYRPRPTAGEREALKEMNEYIHEQNY